MPKWCFTLLVALLVLGAGSTGICSAEGGAGKEAGERFADELLTDPRWHYEAPIEAPPRRGEERPPGNANLWVPPETEVLRGLIVAHRVRLEQRLTRSATIRRAAAEKGLGIIYFDPGWDVMFEYVERDAGDKFERCLEELAEVADRPELPHLPLLTMGHSVGGIFARNIAYWAPDRVIGVIHIKSGNMHHHIPDEDASLAGVPFLAINGELEEVGPEGGLREEYGRETQWIMMRKQMLERREKDRDHLMSMIVHPGGDHTNWSEQLTELCALFIRRAAAHRLPELDGRPEQTVQCRDLDREAGWLSDSRIKSPGHAPAAYADYAGGRAEAFWHLDEQMARAIEQYHAKGFENEAEDAE